MAWELVADGWRRTGGNGRVVQLRRRGETAICRAKEAGRGGQGGDGVDDEAEARQYIGQDPLLQREATQEAK